MCRSIMRVPRTLTGAAFGRHACLMQLHFEIARLMRARHSILLLMVLTAFTLTGCNAKPPGGAPSATGQSAASASDSVEVPVATSQADKAGRDEGNVEAATPKSSKTTIAAPVKTFVPPSPEQIAKWEIVDHQPLRLLGCLDGPDVSYLQSMAISPDGQQFVLAGGKLTLWKMTDAWKTTEPDNPVDLLANYKSGEVERPIRSVAISPNGEWIAAGDEKGMLRIWAMSDQRELVAIRAHDGRLTQMAFSPDSQKLATTSYSGEVRVWKATDGTNIKSLKASNREVGRMVFLTDNLLATASNEVGLWDVETGKKESVLTKGAVIEPMLGLSRDKQLLAFTDINSRTQFWDLQKSSAAANPLSGAHARWIDFTQDGKRIATYSAGSTIRIWDASTGQTLQVIDADGGKTAALQWLPQCDALLVASEQGRVRIWGTLETAQPLSLDPIQLPTVAPIAVNSRKAWSSAQLQRAIDIRSLARLPSAFPISGELGMFQYSIIASRSEVESFYRYTLGKAGWTESTSPNPSPLEITFHKDGCALNVLFMSASGPSGEQGLQVTIQFTGNYDVRWLPKVSPVDSNSTFASFSLVAYRTKASLTDVEVAMLKQFHEAGWTAYTRLAASTAETPDSRTISMLQGGSVLTISISRPADSTDELAVQTSVRVFNKSLPIPADAGWIEFDYSTDVQLVANTKMDLKQTTDFFDTEMAAEGWLSRETGRHTKDEKSWLPYVRGQQDVLIRLVTLPDGGTRVIVGDAERSSWQLQKPSEDKKDKKPGIEAADFALPKGATAIKFEVDQKQISFELAGVAPPKLAEQFVKQMETLEWKKEDRGVNSDEYVFITFSKAKAEVEIRIRAEAKKSTALIGGDGLLWNTPLPTAPVRISYEAWLRRNRKVATLDLLDDFAEEMRKIPVVGK